ncbi:hypothetical protein E6H37_07065 [Candidatus Bathyarchaeota archaeon]|nr:MAG: hypothetical protein E6H37_07065 [Candidatus Bathyarchaeota archaeon]
MGSEDNDAFEDRFSDQARKKALEMFDHQPETMADEYNYRELFTRILSEKDWTDKLESAAVKIRNRFHLRNIDTKLSRGLKALIPDMKEVAKAYDEMTTGYKEFIKNVLDAKRSRVSKARTKDEPDRKVEPLKDPTRRK